MNTYDIVVESLDNAIHDGYKDEVDEMSDETLAYDLMAYVDELETLPFNIVYSAVRKYRYG